MLASLIQSAMGEIKIWTLGASLASGGAAVAGETIGWNATILAVSASVLAIVGLVMSFLDKRKIAEADTKSIIIKSHEETIAFLKSQLEKCQSDLDAARDRSHKLNDDAQSLLLKKEMQLSTFRAILSEHNIALPVFSDDISVSPIFPQKSDS